MRQIALTALGPDRPGIISGLCRMLFEVGGNLLDTSMTILSGQFAMILVVTIPTDLAPRRLENLIDRCRKDLGIEIHLRELTDAPPSSDSEDVDQYLVTVMGSDRPGIVFKVAEVMANRGINITDLNTRIAGGDGPPIYIVLMEVCPPPACDMVQMSTELASLGRQLDVEITVRPMDRATL